VLLAARGRSTEGPSSSAMRSGAASGAAIEQFGHAVNPVDRAGAYTVDGPATLLVARYEGCCQNVLGLSMVRLGARMHGLGDDRFDLSDPTRAQFL